MHTICYVYMTHISEFRILGLADGKTLMTLCKFQISRVNIILKLLK